MAVSALGLEVDCDDADSDSDPLDLMKAISREQLSDSRDMATGFVHSFRLESVLESTEKQQLQTDNYNCQISQIFLFL